MNVLIIGAGALGREISKNLRGESNIVIKGFLIKQLIDSSETIHGFPILGADADLGTLVGVHEIEGVFIAISCPVERRSCFERLSKNFPHLKYPNYVCGRVPMTETQSSGKGSIILTNIDFGPNVSIGDFFVAYRGVCIEHDCKIGDFVTLAPGVTLAGGVLIESDVQIYTGVNVIPNISIKKGVNIGAGSLVMKDCDEASLYYGMPARLIRTIGRR